MQEAVPQPRWAGGGLRVRLIDCSGNGIALEAIFGLWYLCGLPLR